MFPLDPFNHALRVLKRFIVEIEQDKFRIVGNVALSEEILDFLRWPATQVVNTRHSSSFPFDPHRLLHELLRQVANPLAMRLRGRLRNKPAVEHLAETRPAFLRITQE